MIPLPEFYVLLDQTKIELCTTQRSETDLRQT